MRWVFLNPIKEQGWGGMENWMLRLVAAFDASGDDCGIVGRAAVGWEDRLEGSRCRFHPFRFRMDLWPPAILRLRRIFREAKPDVVVAKGFRQARYARLADPEAPILIKLPNPRDLTNEAFDRWTYRWCVDRVLVDSAAARRVFLRRSWVLPGKIRVVHNGLTVPDPDEVDRGRLRRLLGIGDQAFVVGCIGRLEAGKRVEDAVRAFARIAAGALEGEPAVLAVIGDGPERGALERCATDLSIGDRVRFLGWRSDARALVEGCDCLIHPSASEGFPNVVLEAMAVGAVPVATRVGGTPEMIRNGVDGWLVDRGDVDAMASRLSRLATDEEVRARMADAAVRRARDRFGVDRMAAEIRAIAAETATTRAASRMRPIRSEGWRWVRRSGVPAASAASLELPGRAGVVEVKGTHKSLVVSAEIEGRQVYAKRFRVVGPRARYKALLRQPKAIATFRTAQRLDLHGCAVVPHLAAGRREDTRGQAESTLVTGIFPDAEGLRACRDRHPGAADRRRLAAACGRWLAGLHAVGIRPHDLKDSNILVVDNAGDGLAPVLLDLDNSRIGLPSWRFEIVRNLYQLYRSFRADVAPGETCAFLAAYRRKRGLNRSTLRRLAADVAARAARAARGEPTA